MSNSNVSNYTNYFRNLAIRHYLLRHNPESETGNAPAESKRFTRWSADEVVTGLNTQIGFPALLLEIFEVTTSSSSNYDVKNNPVGAITVLSSATPGDTAAELQAFDTTMQIVADLLQQMWTDVYGPNRHNCNEAIPFEEFYLNGIQFTPVGPLFQMQYGWRVEFGFKFKKLFTINQAPAPGTFIENQSQS